MRTIRKGAEPTAWVEHRSRPGAAYDDANAPKDELRRALSKEQGALCCYCLGRIAPAPKRMKVEHWASQHRHPHRQLDYANLLGACQGGEGSPPSQQHCDTAKGEADLAINPADPSRECSALLTYLHNGKLEAEAAGADARVLLGMAAKLEEPDETGSLRPFCQAGVFWLTRQARKRSGPRAG